MGEMGRQRKQRKQGRQGEQREIVELNHELSTMHQSKIQNPHTLNPSPAAPSGATQFVLWG